MADAVATLSVKVVPGASRTRVAGRYGDGIKVQVAVAPEKGKANDAVVSLLAEWLEVHPSCVQITRGLTAPRKTVRVSGMANDALQAKLDAL